ncbi:MAG TPA: hypothetical protein VNR89_17520 [Roseomonas sp.]|nr:hypothetical protein [Roseomonas sp.]
MTTIDITRVVEQVLEAFGIALDTTDGEVPSEAWIELRVAPEGTEVDVHLQPDANALHVTDATLLEALAEEEGAAAEQVVQKMLASRTYLELRDDGLYHPAR